MAAEKLGVKFRFAADTHLHADFLSGAVQLSRDDGATVVAWRRSVPVPFSALPYKDLRYPDL